MHWLAKLKHLFVFLVDIKQNMSAFLVCNYNYPHCQYCMYHSNVNGDPLSIRLMEWTIYHPQWCIVCPFNSRIKLRKWHLAHKLQRIVKLQKLIFSLWKCHFSEIIPKFFFWFRSTREEMPIDTNVNYNSEKCTYYRFIQPSRWNRKKNIVIIYKNRTFSIHLD